MIESIIGFVLIIYLTIGIAYTVNHFDIVKNCTLLNGVLALLLIPFWIVIPIYNKFKKKESEK